MRRLETGSAGLAIAAAIALTACGGGSNSSSTSGTSASFVIKANAACQTGSAAFLAAQAKPVTSTSAAVALAGNLAGIVQQEVSSLKALTPPSNVASAYQTFVGKQQEQLSDLQAGKSAAQKNDNAAFTASQARFFAATVQSLPYASTAGLSICAEQLPASDQAAIKQLAVTTATHPTASDCTSVFTQRLIATNFGGSVAKCQQEFPKGAAPSASVLVLYGVLPAATVILHQGSKPSSVVLDLLKVNGTWKIDSAQAPSPYVPPAQPSTQSTPGTTTT